MNGLMESEEAKKLLGNREKVEALSKSGDGRLVMELAEKNDLAGALKSGDTAKVQSAVSDILSTESGKRLMAELNKLMKK